MTVEPTRHNAHRALIAAGGTGGHVYPALAVAGALSEQGWTVEWIGTERGIEHRLVPASGIPLHCQTCRVFEEKVSLIEREAWLG